MKYISYLAIFLFIAIQLAGCGSTDLSSNMGSQGHIAPHGSELVPPHDETLDQIQDTEEQLEEQGLMEQNPGEMQVAVEDIKYQGKAMYQEELNNLAHEMAVIEQIEEFERQNRMLVEAISLPVQ